MIIIISSSSSFYFHEHMTDVDSIEIFRNSSICVVSL
jgi:hypothetical protein